MVLTHVPRLKCVRNRYFASVVVSLQLSFECLYGGTYLYCKVRMRKLTTNTSVVDLTLIGCFSISFDLICKVQELGF